MNLEKKIATRQSFGEALEKVGILKYERDKYDELHEIYDVKGYKNSLRNS